MKEKRPKKEPLDVNYILKTYWNFIKKYKAICFSLIFIVLIITLMNYSTRYLFKKVIDNGEMFDQNITFLLIFFSSNRLYPNKLFD